MNADHIRELEHLISVLSEVQTGKKRIIEWLRDLKHQYTQKKLAFSEYNQQRDAFLKGKTKESLIAKLKAREYELLSRIDRILGNMFTELHAEQPVVKAAHTHDVEKDIAVLKTKLKRSEQTKIVQQAERKLDIEQRFGALPTLKFRRVKKIGRLPSFLKLNLSPKDARLELSDAIDYIKHIGSPGLFASIKEAFRKKRKSVGFRDVVTLEQTSFEKPEKELTKADSGVILGWSSRRIIRDVLDTFRRKQEPIIGESTAVPSEMKKLRQMREKLYERQKTSDSESALLVQEAQRVKRLIAVEKKEIYQGSSLGVIANVTVRRFSLWLVNSFPTLFGSLYNSLRAANIRVLSNTYVNIMVLITLTITMASFVFLIILFFSLGQGLIYTVFRSFLFSVLAGVASAAGFYFYPFLRIRERRRKTTVNLPFAINHMAAVSTSGVPPSVMFELIAGYGEYEEVSIEVKKMVDYMHIFGYDLLTAIKTVATTTPSPVFKKFLDGMVSTVETGGDLTTYLRNQADEAALTYKLERQRYNETVSTYSDIYTGVLIAAPLFFVSALALVNLLGGSLGGFSVGVVLAVGAYLIIPLLNVAFLVFLQFTQPEV